MSKHGGYGYIPDTPDDRDFKFAVAAPAVLPPHVDLCPKMPPVYDQGQLGSCTANALAALVEYQEHRQAEKTGTPSRLFIYYGERVIENTVQQDSGAMIRDGMKVVAKQGAPPETDWPYDITKFTVKPPPKAFNDAVKHKALVYQRIAQSAAGIKAALAAGFPVVFGFTVKESFESDAVAATGVVPMPQPGEKTVGGHAVLAVGYDEPSQRFIVRNSWGANWGQHGYFTMPYAYLTDPTLASDFWTINKEM